MRGRENYSELVGGVRKDFDSHPGSVYPCIQLVAASIHKKIPNLIVFLCFPLHIMNKEFFFFGHSHLMLSFLFFSPFMNTSKKYILISFERTQALFSSLSLDILLAPSHTYSQYTFLYSLRFFCDDSGCYLYDRFSARMVWEAESKNEHQARVTWGSERRFKGDFFTAEWVPIFFMLL